MTTITYYGWYSHTQFERSGKSYIYSLEHSTTESITVTEVTRDPTQKSMFEDAIYYGKIGNYLSSNTYEDSIIEDNNDNVVFK